MRHSRDRSACFREKCDVAKRIDVLFYSKPEQLRPIDAAGELPAIGVPVPANSADHRAIHRSERDQITATAVIRTEHKSAPREFGERRRDVGGIEVRTIDGDGDNFFVSRRTQRLDRILESLRKCFAYLWMKARTIRTRKVSATEDVQISAATIRRLVLGDL